MRFAMHAIDLHNSAGRPGEAMPADRWISILDAGELLGLGRTTVQRLCASGRLAAYKPAGCRRTLLRLSEVTAWMEAQRAAPRAATWSPSVRNRPTCSVFKRRRNRNGRLEESRAYYAEVGLPGQPPQRVALGVTDKRLAQRKAEDLLRGLEAKSIEAPDLGAAERWFAKPLQDVIDIYVASRRQQCRPSSEWPEIIGNRLEKLMRECGWATLRDVTAASLSKWMRSEAAAGAASKTCNQYRDIVLAWLAWLREVHEVPVPSLAKKVEEDQRGVLKRERRAAPAADTARLMRVVAEHAPRWFVHYHLALTYELRRGDIEAMVRDDVYAIDGDREWWRRPEQAEVVMHLHSSVAKGKRDRVFALRDDTKRLLAARWAAGDDGADLVFPEGAPSMELVREHLALAGIPFTDARGRRLDFHGLRHSAITHSGRLGNATSKQRAMLAGHADPRTTEGYTHEELIETRTLIEAMPRHDAEVELVLARGRGTGGAGTGGTGEGTIAVGSGGLTTTRPDTTDPGDSLEKWAGLAKAARPGTGELGFEAPPVVGQIPAQNAAAPSQGTRAVRAFAAWLHAAPAPVPDDHAEALWAWFLRTQAGEQSS